MFNDLKLPEKFKSLLDSGVDGYDIVHGFCKELMVKTEERLSEYNDHENEEYEQTVNRLVLEGYMEALGDIYNLTYAIALHIARGE